jgi:hypothetical protein
LLTLCVFAGERLADFRIGVTNNDPEERPPVPGDYETCATSEAAMGLGATSVFPCEANGRYVIVQLNGENYFTVCELEVFGSECSFPLI